MQPLQPYQATLQGRVIRGKLQDLRTWLGVNRRRQDVLHRLHRVLTCEVLQRQGGTYKRYAFSTQYAIRGDNFEIHLEETFVQDAREGFVYSLDAVCQLRSRTTALTLYFGVLVYVDRAGMDRDYTHDYDPYQQIPRPRSRSKAAQTLCKNIGIVSKHMEDDVGIRRNAIRCGVVIDFGTPRRLTRAGGGSLAESRARDRRARAMTPSERRIDAKLTRKYRDLEQRTQRLEARNREQRKAQGRLTKALGQTVAMIGQAATALGKVGRQRARGSPDDDDNDGHHR